MLTLSSRQRLLLFLLPLVAAVLLLWIPVRDALEVAGPDADTYAGAVPEGHHWLAFTLSEDGASDTDATLLVALEFETIEKQVGADNRTVVFDLEDEESVREMTVLWADGREQSFPYVAVDEVHELVYPKTINDALAAQWALRGIVFRFWVYVGVAAVVILFGLRVLSWAQAKETHA